MGRSAQTANERPRISQPGPWGAHPGVGPSGYCLWACVACLAAAARGARAPTWFALNVILLNLHHLAAAVDMIVLFTYTSLILYIGIY